MKASWIPLRMVWKVTMAEYITETRSTNSMTERSDSRPIYFPRVQGTRRLRIFQFSLPYWENGMVN